MKASSLTLLWGVAFFLMVFLFSLCELKAQQKRLSQSVTTPSSESTQNFESAVDEDASIRKFAPWQTMSHTVGYYCGSCQKEIVAKGVNLGVSFVNEVWGNTVGGLKRGTVAPGLIQLATGVDLEKLVHWKGASFYSRWACITGEDPGPTLTGDLFGVSNIAGLNTFRNVELWLQQNFLEDKISLRAGQIVADSEFIISDYAALFINNTFGWPAFIFTSIPNGGPGYPTGVPGFRIRLEPTESFSLKAGIFDGVYSQSVNNHGFYWDLNQQDGLFYITEAAYRYQCRELPGQVKAGAWGSSGNFINMATPSTSLNGDYGFYWIIDQMIYRPLTFADKKNLNSTPTPTFDRGLGTFARIAFEPANLNLMSFYFDTGFNYKGLFPKRENDLLGIAMTYGQMTSTGLNSIQQSQGTAPAWMEMIFELTYQAQINSFLSLQPDLQYIINPGTTQNLPNALVIGLRASLTF
ncbi:MAG: carbohydrate porin [Chthoniobacterales bacterium]|nr:carbohydrate porin [Chthoniobacterales bacterium]